MSKRPREIPSPGKRILTALVGPELLTRSRARYRKEFPRISGITYRGTRSHWPDHKDLPDLT